MKMGDKNKVSKSSSACHGMHARTKPARLWSHSFKCRAAYNGWTTATDHAEQLRRENKKKKKLERHSVCRMHEKICDTWTDVSSECGENMLKKKINISHSFALLLLLSCVKRNRFLLNLFAKLSWCSYNILRRFLTLCHRKQIEEKRSKYEIKTMWAERINNGKALLIVYLMQNSPPVSYKYFLHSASFMPHEHSEHVDGVDVDNI